MLRFVLAALAAVFSMSLSAQTGLKVGQVAPPFQITDQNGTEISLEAALKKGPVVLVFYRGQWCPFCKKALSQLQDSLQLLTAEGATVIAVSPEVAQNVQKMATKTRASFHVGSDSGLRIMKAYDVAYSVPEETQRTYRSYGLDFEELNGENGPNLPVPATYVIGTDGTVRYTFFNPDYKQRASVAAILAEVAAAR